MPNIYDILDTLERTQKSILVSNSKKDFFKSLLDGTLPDHQARPFEQIAKNPPIEHKISRIRTAVNVALDTSSSRVRTVLRKMLKALDTQKSNADKIADLRDLSAGLDSKSSTCIKAVQREVNRDIPPDNEFDHILAAINHQLKQTSWFAIADWRALRNVRSQIEIFQRHQAEFHTRIQLALK